MKRTSKSLLPLMMLAWAMQAGGCEDKPSSPLAPSATALAPARTAAAAARQFAIDKASSKVDFMMPAPVEKIRGRVHGATEGNIQVDTSDITKTSGLLTVDISGIELYQTVADDKGNFGEEKKSDLQNKHARSWLEIAEDAPEDARKKNSRVEFSISSIEALSDKN